MNAVPVKKLPERQKEHWLGLAALARTIAAGAAVLGLLVPALQPNPNLTYLNIFLASAIFITMMCASFDAVNRAYLEKTQWTILALAFFLLAYLVSGLFS